MAPFNFPVLVQDPPARVLSACLGADANNPLTMADVTKTKAVQMAALQNYVLAVQDNDIEGFAISLEDFTCNDGFAFGSVQIEGRFVVEIGPNSTALAVGAYVVADDQTALNTEDHAMVKNGAGVSFIWRVIRLMAGTGAVGDMILIERV